VAATRLVSNSSSTVSEGKTRLGDLVYVKYLDHSWFRNADPDTVGPIIQEAWGRLDRDEPDHITVVAASYVDPTLKHGKARRITGLAIVRSTILELRRVD
jgi:hypothetical protein